MAAHKRIRRKDDDRAPAHRPRETVSEDGSAISEGPRVGGRDVLQLQQIAGNAAVTRLVQREARPDDEAAGADAIASPLPLHLRSLALGLIESGRLHNQPRLVQIGQKFLKTGQLELLALQAGVMEQPQFLGRRVALLRRGTPVTVLDKKESWMLVLTPGGKTGWMHSSRLIPKVVVLRPGETGSGSTRDESETARRG
jgi:hypothetical protein